MRPSEVVRERREAIVAIVRANDTQNPRIFGSIARGEDDETSDIDLLVDSVPEMTTLLSLARIKRAVEALTGIATDVATPGSLNPRYRDSIIKEAIEL